MRSPDAMVSLTGDSWLVCETGCGPQALWWVAPGVGLADKIWDVDLNAGSPLGAPNDQWKGSRINFPKIDYITITNRHMNALPLLVGHSWELNMTWFLWTPSNMSQGIASLVKRNAKGHIASWSTTSITMTLGRGGGNVFFCIFFVFFCSGFVWAYGERLCFLKLIHLQLCNIMLCDTHQCFLQYNFSLSSFVGYVVNYVINF